MRASTVATATLFGPLLTNRTPGSDADRDPGEKCGLKGALLYAAWLDDPFRTTRDLDLLSLAAAVRATFDTRATAIPRERPPPLTPAFSEDPRKLQQWRSFLARDPLLIDEPDLQTVIREVGSFIMPAALAAAGDRGTPGFWTFDGGWGPAA